MDTTPAKLKLWRHYYNTFLNASPQIKDKFAISNRSWRIGREPKNGNKTSPSSTDVSDISVDDEMTTANDTGPIFDYSRGRTNNATRAINEWASFSKNTANTITTTGKDANGVPQQQRRGSEQSSIVPRKNVTVLHFDLDQVDAELFQLLETIQKDPEVHDCQPDCAVLHPRFETFQKKIQAKKTMNNFLKPFYYGFRRISLKSENERVVMYQTYCGKLLKNLSEVAQCLEVMQLRQLAVSDFTFSLKLHFNIKPFVAFNSVPDISFGNEARPIPFYNFCDSGTFPWPKGAYLSTNVFDKGTINVHSLGELKSHSQCECTESEQFSKAYTHGLLHYIFECEKLIECNENCRCDIQCPNRVVSRGIRVNLAVRFIKDKNIGIVAMQFIPRGTFVGTYVGVWFKDVNVDSNYSLANTLSLVKDAKVIDYTLNNENDGNFGRYFNHSCDPNLFIQKVYIKNYDLHFPNFALFTSQDVNIGEELCWDYCSPAMLSTFHCTCEKIMCSGIPKGLKLKDTKDI